MTRIELERLFRHALVPLVAVGVTRGYLPEGVESDVIEAGAIFLAYFLTLLWSRRAERRAREEGK